MRVRRLVGGRVPLSLRCATVGHRIGLQPRVKVTLKCRNVSTDTHADVYRKDPTADNYPDLKTRPCTELRRHDTVHEPAVRNVEIFQIITSHFGPYPSVDLATRGS